MFMSKKEGILRFLLFFENRSLYLTKVLSNRYKALHIAENLLVCTGNIMVVSIRQWS